MGHSRHVRERAGAGDSARREIRPPSLHFWDLHTRKHRQTIDFGDKYQLVFELRPAHDPTKAYGFVNCVLSLKTCPRRSGYGIATAPNGRSNKVIEIPAEPADPESFRRCCKGFKAVPPLVTDIDLSMDGRFLYVACWGTGDLQQYDVSDPFHTKLTGKVQDRRHCRPHDPPGAKDRALNGSRRWWRSAVTDSVSISPTRSTASSTSSSIRMASRAGW